MTEVEFEKYKEDVLSRVQATSRVFTMEDIKHLMLNAGFVYFKAMASRAMPGIVNVLIGHDDYIKEDIQETLKYYKPCGVMFHLVDCNGYGWWA